MKKIIRTTAGVTDRVGPILGGIFALIGFIMASSALTPDVSSTQTTLDNSQALPVPAARVTGSRAAEISGLAGVRLEAAAAQSDTPNQATLTTDRDDYAPYSFVYISGTGFFPGETVNLIVAESSPNPGVFEPWNVVADENGSFETTWYVFSEDLIGATLQLTATGQSSGMTASATFTDAAASGVAPNGDPGGFEVLGNVLATAGSGHTDWVMNGVGTNGLLTNAGVPIDSTVTFRRLDMINSGDDVFSGSNMMNENPNAYTWKTASAGNKSDLNNVYVHISVDSNNDRWVTASADRLANNGTAFVDFELSQASLTQVTDTGCSSAPCGHFVTDPAGAVSGDPLFATGGRTPSDLLVTAQYNNGGAVATILIYRWTLVSGTYKWVDITSSIPNSAAFVATNTVDGVSVPYGAFGNTTYSKNQFVEMSVNVSELVKAGTDPCVGIAVRSVFVKTKTSTSASAPLDDFVTPISVTFNAGFNISLTQTSVSCFGGANGSVTATVAGGTPPYQVTLDAVTQTITTNGGSTTFTGVTVGTKIVHVVATGGCSKDSTITVTQPNSALSASVTSQTNIACFGASSGSVTVAGSGGTSPYTYSIDGTHFGSSGTFNNLAAGSYTVTVKDGNGCTTTQPVSIAQPTSTLTAAITSQTNVACFGASTGSVTVAGSGGTSPYTYSIDGTHFGSSGTFNNLAAGSYSVTVKDGNGCTTAQPVSITQPTSALSASLTSQTNVSCFGASTGSVTVAGSGGTSPYMYSIDGTHFGSSGTFSNLAAGSYTVTVRDGNDCTTTQPVGITQPTSALSASITSQTNVACFGSPTGSVTVAGSGGTSPYSYSIDGTHFGSSGTFSSLAAGSYTVTVRDGNGCATTQPVSITQPTSALGASVTSQTNVACFGSPTGSVTVAGSGGTSPYTYSIDGTHFGSSGTFNNLAAASYTVTVRDGNGCTTTQPVAITQPTSALSASITSQTNVACFGSSTGSVTVAGSGGTSPYSYSIDGTNFASSGTFNNLAAGSYTVTVRDGNGCTATQSVSITQPTSALSASITSQTNVACFGSSTGGVTVAGSGGTSPYTYSINGSTIFGSSGTFSNLAAGSYTVTVKDANDCTTTQPVVITQPTSALSVAVTAQTNAACFGASTGSVTVAGSGGTSPYSYSIDGTNFGSSGTFNNLAAGSYTVTVKDGNGCTTTQPVNITQPTSALSAAVTSQTNVACFGSSTGSVTVAGSGGTSPYAYSIDGINFGSSGTFSNLAAGSYTVTVRDGHGCTTTQPVAIAQPIAPLSASALATNPACSGGLGSISVAASAGVPPYTYSLNGGAFQTSNTFTGLAAGSHTVGVMDANGCIVATGATVAIPTPVISSSTKTDPMCHSQLGSMTVTFSGGTPGYQCSQDNGPFSPCTSPATFNNLSAGSHTIRVRDSHGCLGPAQTKTVNVPSAVQASVTTTLASSAATADGTLTIRVTGGVAPYAVRVNSVTHTISMSGGQTTFAGVRAGTLNVNITDANDCGLGIVAQVGAVPPPTLQIGICTIRSSIGTGQDGIFRFTLTGGSSSHPLTIYYTMSGSAHLGTDYTLSGTVGRIVIPAGQTLANVTIHALPNSARTTDRQATMTITNGSGYFFASGNRTSTITIRH
jgi:hypothetical protein